jgi:hypothetical protein
MLYRRAEIGKQDFRKKSSENGLRTTPTKRHDEIESWLSISDWNKANPVSLYK